MNFIRLFIAHARDAIAQQQIERELCFIRDYLPSEAGYECAQVISEDAGLMVGLLTVWSSREAVTLFQDSGLNQLLTAVTKLRITGTPVVKLFRIIR